MLQPIVINELLNLIRYGRTDNSYKMIWARAIVDLASDDPERESMSLIEIAEKVFSYYWNIHIFFDPDGRTLKQGNNSLKPPVLLQLVIQSIQTYKKTVRSAYKPIFYEKVDDSWKSQYGVDINAIVAVLNKDVRHRFLNSSHKQCTIYDYQNNNEKLIFEDSVCKQISDYKDILHEAILFRWTQILEDINRTTPRIASKLKIKQEELRKRKSLKRFIPILELENPEKNCSICKKQINQSDLSVDHLIPWSFLYSDDIWNLSLTHKSCNSSKNNIPPKEADITAQHQRNLRLYKVMSNNSFQAKVFKDLQYANSENLLRKMFQIYR